MNLLLTGAAGRIGRVILPELQRRYRVRAFDRQPVMNDPHAVIGDLRDFFAIKSAMTGMETVIHLAATPDNADFDQYLLPNNIIGVQNLYRAAVETKVRRVIFASSVQTVMARNPDEGRIEVTAPVRPVSLYGVTKVFGDALGRYYHDKHALEVICARLGAFQHPDRLVEAVKSRWLRFFWLSPRDAIQFFCRAVDTPGVGFLISFVTSKSATDVFSLDSARLALGYEPQDDIVVELSTINIAKSPPVS